MERPWVFGYTELAAMIRQSVRQTRVFQSAIALF